MKPKASKQLRHGGGREAPSRLSAGSKAGKDQGASPRAVQIGLALLLFVATFAAHLPATWAGFVWDDRVSLLENDLITGENGLYRFWFTTEPADYWPLSATTLWIEWRLWGNHPTPYHITNIILHGLAVVVLFQIFKRMGLGTLGAFLGALLFAIHPVTVASAAWIAERKNVLSILLFLASILAYFRYQDEGRKRYYQLALVAGLAALLAKTSVVALPIVLLVVTGWRYKRISSRDLLHTAPFFLFSLALGLATIWYQHNNACEEGARNEELASRIAASGWVIWFYLYKFAAPLNLAIIYPRWTVDSTNVLSYVPLLLIGVVFGVLWKYRLSWGRNLLTAVGLFVLVLGPVLGLVTMAFAQYSLVADHLMYPGLPVLAALVGGGFATILSKVRDKQQRMPAMAAAAMIGAVYLAAGVLTWRQAAVYQNEEALWSHTLRHNDRAWSAYNNRGNIHESRKEYAQAIADYTKAIELRSAYPKAHYNRGKCYWTIGDHDRAIDDYTAAISYEPRYAQAYNSRGVAYSSKGDLAQAIRDYTRAIEFQRDNANAYCNRGDAYRKLGDYESAIQDLNRVIDIKPRLAVAYNLRGDCFIAKGDFDRALADLSKAVELQPNYPEALNNRSVALCAKGLYDHAIRDCTRAVELHPEYGFAFYNRGFARDAKGEYDLAIEDYTKVIELQPDNAKAYNNRGVIYSKLGDQLAAVRDCGKAIELLPDYAKAYSARGTALGQMGEHAQAVQDLSKAIELQPHDAGAYHNRAATFFIMKEYDRAWADIHQCRRLGGIPNPDMLADLIQASGRSE